MFQILLAVIYLAFISLGLPDALLGSGWPVMYQEFDVPVSYAGVISMIISAGTIVSSLQSDRLTRKLGTGKVTMLSVALTAVALFGFSTSHSFWLLCLWSIPYGLGAGSVDASLNNYVALHYASRHMSWLHCMWGIGASMGPYIMGYVLSNGQIWNMGYRYIAIIQIFLTMILFFSLPLWKGRNTDNETSVSSDTGNDTSRPLNLKEIFALPGAKAVMITFFCYCALEQTAGLWAGSYLVLHRGLSEETAATFASLFYLGITVGRACSGFLTMKFNDSSMIRMGQSLIVVGIAALLLAPTDTIVFIGLIFVGLGCAPIYPCIIHSTPDHFGADRSQAIIGVQMASAYIGTCLAPPVFGIIANHISVALYPVYLLAILILMIAMHEKLIKQTAA